MSESKAELILHPIRLRIIQTLIGGVERTAQQIGELLPDVAQATLYRHINKLAAAGLLVVVAERQARGAIEKVYALSEQAANLSPEEIARLSADDHMRYFTTFVATLLQDFARYLQTDRIDLRADGVGYRQVALYLDDQEFLELAAAVNAAILPALANQPAPGRHRRLFSTIVMPSVNGTDENGIHPEG